MWVEMGVQVEDPCLRRLEAVGSTLRLPSISHEVNLRTNHLGSQVRQVDIPLHLESDIFLPRPPPSTSHPRGFPHRLSRRRHHLQVPLGPRRHSNQAQNPERVTVQVEKAGMRRIGMDQE